MTIPATTKTTIAACVQSQNGDMFEDASEFWQDMRRGDDGSLAAYKPPAS